MMFFIDEGCRTGNFIFSAMVLSVVYSNRIKNLNHVVFAGDINFNNMMLINL